MPQVFSWKKKFNQGKLGEELFAKHFKLNGEELKDSGVREYDFTTASGLKVELKTDMYISDNFFIEYYSVEVSKKPGSVWQSRNHGVDVFIYWFPNSKDCYIFSDVEAVCTYLESYIHSMNLTPIPVHNKGYTATGFKIPKSALAHLCTRVELDVTHEDFVKGA